MRPIDLSQNIFCKCRGILSPYEDYAFYQSRRSAFKQMFLEQGEGFWICFATSFRSFSQIEMRNFLGLDSVLDLMESTFISILGELTQKRRAPTELMDHICVVARNMELVFKPIRKSHQNNPFVMKDTRAAFRRLFGEPSAAGGVDSLSNKVKLLAHLYMRFGMAVCKLLRVWLEGEPQDDMIDTSKDFAWEPPPSWSETTYLPKAFEVYLLHFWEDRLFLLIPVEKKNVAWWDTAYSLENMMQTKLSLRSKGCKAKDFAVVKAVRALVPHFPAEVMHKVMVSLEEESSEPKAKAESKSKILAEDFAKMTDLDKILHSREFLPLSLPTELWKAKPRVCASFVSWSFFLHVPPSCSNSMFLRHPTQLLLNEWYKQVARDHHVVRGCLHHMEQVIRNCENDGSKKLLTGCETKYMRKVLCDASYTCRMQTDLVEKVMETISSDASALSLESLTSPSLILKLPWTQNLCRYWFDSMLTMVYELKEILAPLYYFSVPKKAYDILRKFDKVVLKETHAVLILASMNMDVLSLLESHMQCRDSQYSSARDLRENLERCLSFLAPRLEFITKHKHRILDELMRCLSEDTKTKKMQQYSSEEIDYKPRDDLVSQFTFQSMYNDCSELQLKKWEYAFLMSYRHFYSWMQLDLCAIPHIDLFLKEEMDLQKMMSILKAKANDDSSECTMSDTSFLMKSVELWREVFDRQTMFWEGLRAEEFKDHLAKTNCVLDTLVKEGNLHPQCLKSWHCRKYSSAYGWKKGAMTVTASSWEERTVFTLVQELMRVNDFVNNFWDCLHNKIPQLADGCLHGVWLKHDEGENNDTGTAASTSHSQVEKTSTFHNSLSKDSAWTPSCCSGKQLGASCEEDVGDRSSSVFRDMFSAIFRHHRTQVLAKLNVAMHKLAGLHTEIPTSYLNNVRSYLLADPSAGGNTYSDYKCKAMILDASKKWNQQSLDLVLGQHSMQARSKVQFTWRQLGSTVSAPEITLPAVRLWLESFNRHTKLIVADMYSEYFKRDGKASIKLFRFPYHQTLEDFFPQEVHALRSLLVEDKFREVVVVEQVKRQIQLLIVRLKWMEKEYMSWQKNTGASQQEHADMKIQEPQKYFWLEFCELQTRFLKVHAHLGAIFSHYLKAGGLASWPYQKETMGMIEAFLDAYGVLGRRDDNICLDLEHSWSFRPKKLWPVLENAEKLCGDCLQEWGSMFCFQDWAIHGEDLLSHCRLIYFLDYVFTNYYFTLLENRGSDIKTLHKNAIDKIMGVGAWLQQKVEAERGGGDGTCSNSQPITSPDVLEKLVQEGLDRANVIVGDLPRPRKIKLHTELPRDIVRNEKWMETYRSVMKYFAKAEDLMDPVAVCLHDTNKPARGLTDKCRDRAPQKSSCKETTKAVLQQDTSKSVAKKNGTVEPKCDVNEKEPDSNRKREGVPKLRIVMSSLKKKASHKTAAATVMPCETHDKLTVEHEEEQQMENLASGETKKDGTFSDHRASQQGLSESGKTKSTSVTNCDVKKNDTEKYTAETKKGGKASEPQRARPESQKEVTKMMPTDNVMPDGSHDIASVIHAKEQHAKNLASGDTKQKRHTRSLRQCSMCLKDEPEPRSFKKCHLCALEKRTNQHYYCSKDCQVEDWGKRHRAEHMKLEATEENTKCSINN